MAPVGGNGSFHPRPNPEDFNNRSTLALKLNGQSSLATGPVKPTNAYNKGAGRAGNAGGAGATTGVNPNTEAANHASEILRPLPPQTGGDQILISFRQTLQKMDARRAASPNGKLPPLQPSTGTIHDQQTTQLKLGSQTWSNQKGGSIAAIVNTTAHGFYSMDGAVPDDVAPVARRSTVAAPRKSFGLAAPAA